MITGVPDLNCLYVLHQKADATCAARRTQLAHALSPVALLGTCRLKELHEVAGSVVLGYEPWLEKTIPRPPSIYLRFEGETGAGARIQIPSEVLFWRKPCTSWNIFTPSHPANSSSVGPVSSVGSPYLKHYGVKYRCCLPLELAFGTVRRV